ncbi:MAG: 50S ribosomal protein L11 methyltransferase [Candidatus Binatia bacterium]
MQLSVKAPPSALDAISNFLIEKGSPGVILKRDEVQAFFVRPTQTSLLKRDIQRFLKGIRQIHPGLGQYALRWKILKDKNWNSSWRRFFTPQKVGKSLWITPPWLNPPQTGGRIIIRIEPGMAFGTGTHVTTRCCLEFLEKVTSSLRREKFTALDVGTGSGILSIALARMGAKTVLALDNDPIALKTAWTNVRRNGVERIVTLSRSGLRRIRASFTVVVANLTAETIIGLATALQQRVLPKGYLVLSGILQSKAGEVLRHLGPESFKLAQRSTEKEWVTLLLRKNS